MEREETNLEHQREAPPCVQLLAEHDPAYGEIFSQLFNLTFAPGVLDVKTKMLIAMAVNASTGMGYGCSEIAKILQGIDTTKEEIAEALRVAATVRAIQGVVTGAEAYTE
jgi:alkylhydroperoxidase/carboxymuconolactone decarboxylase family protein YurZ